MRHVSDADRSGWRTRTYFVSVFATDAEQRLSSCTVERAREEALVRETWRWRAAHEPLTNVRRREDWAARYYGLGGPDTTVSAARFAFGCTVPTLALRDGLITHGTTIGRTTHCTPNIEEI